MDADAHYTYTRRYTVYRQIHMMGRVADHQVSAPVVARIQSPPAAAPPPARLDVVPIGSSSATTTMMSMPTLAMVVGGVLAVVL
jgi:hypothetical protein